MTTVTHLCTVPEQRCMWMCIVLILSAVLELRGVSGVVIMSDAHNRKFGQTLTDFLQHYIVCPFLSPSLPPLPPPMLVAIWTKEVIGAQFIS